MTEQENDQSKGPGFADYFKAWADGFERGRHRFLSGLGDGASGGGGSWSGQNAKPEVKTRPEVNAEPAKKVFAHRQKPAEARPTTGGSGYVAGRTDVVDPYHGAYKQDPRQVVPGSKADKAFWADFYAGERNREDLVVGPSYRDPYGAATGAIGGFLRDRGYSPEQVANYIAYSNPDTLSGDERAMMLTPEEKLTLEPDMDFDRWYEMNKGNPKAQWGY